MLHMPHSMLSVAQGTGAAEGLWERLGRFKDVDAGVLWRRRRDGLDRLREIIIFLTSEPDWPAMVPHPPGTKDEFMPMKCLGHKYSFRSAVSHHIW